MASTRRTTVKCDVKALQVLINQLGDRAVKGVSTELRKYGEKIHDQAVLNAPRETKSLENAIMITYERTGINRRLEVKIFVKMDAPYTGKKGPNESGKNVGSYAQKIDTGLAPYGTGRYQARKGTTDKGPQAGGRFIRRAAEEHRAALIARAKEVVRRAVQRRRLRG